MPGGALVLVSPNAVRVIEGAALAAMLAPPKAAAIANANNLGRKFVAEYMNRYLLEKQACNAPEEKNRIQTHQIQALYICHVALQMNLDAIFEPA